MADMELRPIGWVESALVDPELAPKQGDEGAPDAWLAFDPGVVEGLDGIGAGDGIIEDDDIEWAAAQFCHCSGRVIGFAKVTATDGAQHGGDQRSHVGLWIDDQDAGSGDGFAGHGWDQMSLQSSAQPSLRR